MLATHRLSLTVYSADNLRETGFTKQDPYCTVEVGDKTFQTKADKSAGRFPVWNEQMVYDSVPATVLSVKFTIYNKNLVRKDDVIGSAEITLASLQSATQALPVYDKDGLQQGELHIFGTYEESETHEKFFRDIGDESAGETKARLSTNETIALDTHTDKSAWTRIESAPTTVATTAGQEHICQSEVFTVTEDRPVMKERIEIFTEHHPVEREMVREVHVTGNENALGVIRDAGRIEERVLSEAQGETCPNLSAQPEHFY